MKKVVSISLLLGLVVFCAPSQHFIGMHGEVVKKLMKEHHPDFNFDHTMVNKTFNYLKFVDNLQQQTWLFFLDDNDYCVSSKLMCDYILLDEKIEELDHVYKKSGNLTWSYKQNNKTYNVTLKKEEWFFSILTKLKE